MVRPFQKLETVLSLALAKHSGAHLQFHHSRSQGRNIQVSGHPQLQNTSEATAEEGGEGDLGRTHVKSCKWEKNNRRLASQPIQPKR